MFIKRISPTLCITCLFLKFFKVNLCSLYCIYVKLRYFCIFLLSLFMYLVNVMVFTVSQLFNSKCSKQTVFLQFFVFILFFFLLCMLLHILFLYCELLCSCVVPCTRLTNGTFLRFVARRFVVWAFRCAANVFVCITYRVISEFTSMAFSVLNAICSSSFKMRDSIMI